MLTQMLMWAQMILKKVHTFIIKPLECMSAAAKDRIALFSRLNIKCRSTAILVLTKSLNKCEERLLVASSVERNGIPSVFPKDSSATAVRRSSIWSREKEYLRVFSSGGGRTHTCTEHKCCFFRHFLRFFDLSVRTHWFMTSHFLEVGLQLVGQPD